MPASAVTTDQLPYVTIQSRNGNGYLTGEAFDQRANGDRHARSATHDTSRTAFHVKHIGQFAQRLEDSAARAFPNKGRASQRYKSVQALLLHWGSDDLFVLPELEDLEKCLREDYAFGTDLWAIPSENSHLELMMKIGQLIRDHESQDTLFIVYYGGHARIDESRQSTWCATRDAGSPWLQWSAIQTLLERSKSDVLILLDCCAGAASATFPTGNSITETISASSWDAIAPDPGRYSFTNALIEVLQEWRMRVFSVAMLHAEVLARLKHPRPITINGKHFEARSTPVHFMMTSNHKAPSIELSRTRPAEKEVPATPSLGAFTAPTTGRAASPADALMGGAVVSEPTEDTPHVMISLALEEDQRLDINAWEQWLSAFPAMAKYVKIQGVFKSHSTLVLVSMPVMVWDLLPEDPATSFIAFIRSNNVAAQGRPVAEAGVAVPAQNAPQAETTAPDTASFTSGISGTTLTPTENSGPLGQFRPGTMRHKAPLSSLPPGGFQGHARAASFPSSALISRQMILNGQQAQRRTTFGPDAPQPKSFAVHVEKRLEEYYRHQPLPNDAESAFIASNLGIEPLHLEIWFHHRRERELASTEVEEGAVEILPSDMEELLEMSPPSQLLIFDTRPLAEYQASHLAGAMHLRLPQWFVRTATMDMLEQATGPRWREAKCMLFCSGGSDCPSATSLWRRLHEHGWKGKSFVVKARYDPQHNRQFCGDSTAAEERYGKWASRVTRARAEPSSWKPVDEAEVDAEFKLRSGDLYRRAEETARRGSDGKAQMVEYLDRGLRSLNTTAHKEDREEGYVEVDEVEEHHGKGEEGGRRGLNSYLLNKVFRRS